MLQQSRGNDIFSNTPTDIFSSVRFRVRRRQMIIHRESVYSLHIFTYFVISSGLEALKAQYTNFTSNNNHVSVYQESTDTDHIISEELKVITGLEKSYPPWCNFIRGKIRQDYHNIVLQHLKLPCFM